METLFGLKIMMPLLNNGIWQPSYNQGKRLSIKERNKKKMKIHEKKTCLLSAYYRVVATVMQQLLSYTYHHLQT
jgi:hypothetical protein